MATGNSNWKILSPERYHPIISSVWQKETLSSLVLPEDCQLPLPEPCTGIEQYSNSKFVNGNLCFLKPSSIVNVKGDGNCFFRALSYLLFNSEDHHAFVRKSLVHFMEINNFETTTKIKQLSTWEDNAAEFSR